MKILHVHEVYSPYNGGSAIRIKNLCEAQLNDDAELDITVLCTYKGVSEELVPKFEIINKVKVRRIQNIRFIGLYALYYCLFHRINILHVHNSRLFWFVYPFLFWKNIVLEMHSLRQLSKYKDRMQTLSLRLSHKIIVLSKGTKQYIKDSLNVKSQIYVIYNGVDYKKATYQFTSSKEAESECFNLVYAGSIYDWQGVFNIIALAEKLTHGQLKKKFKFTIIGEGPFKSDIMKLRSAKKLEDCVDIKDFMEGNALLEYLQKASAFLFLRPLKRETELTFPLKILEIGLLGLPLIMTNRAAHIEIFPNQDANPYCVIVDDDIDLMCKQILNSLAEYETLCIKASLFRKFTLETDFSWLASGKKINTLYAE